MEQRAGRRVAQIPININTNAIMRKTARRSILGRRMLDRAWAMIGLADANSARKTALPPIGKAAAAKVEGNDNLRGDGNLCRRRQS